MAALEEASARLMQPAKELSDWNYPLAKDLEKYTIAVVETENINYSNAGLVVQNATNAYVRRVDYLSHDSAVMTQSFAENQAADEALKNAKKNSKSKKTAVDLGDFEPIDFAQFVGTNNNLKTRTGTTSSIKLLSQRFPQLENASRSSFPIEVYDVHGEVVGKKYDFRCNQYLTASGMLVEHLTPEDFLDDFGAKENTGASLEIPDSGVALSAITEHCDSGNEDDCDIRENFTGVENPGDSSLVQEKDSDVLDTSFASYADSGLGASLRSPDATMRPESSLSCEPEIPWDSTEPRAGSGLSIGDVNSATGRTSVPLWNSQETTTTTTTAEELAGKTATETENESSQCDSLPGNHNVDENENTVNRVDAGDQQPSDDDEIVVRQSRRSKRIKNLIDAVNELNSKPWEPIPFDGVSEKNLGDRSEFKLPCPLKLLKGKEKSRKRKITSRKKRGLASFLGNESEPGRKKMAMYSPTRQLFLSFKEERFEDLKRGLELHFKNGLGVAAIHYEAVTNISEDLLGYKTNVQKSDRNTIVDDGSRVGEECRDRADLDAINYEAVTDISKDLSGFKTNVSKSDSPFRGDEGTNESSVMEPIVEDFPTLETIDDTEAIIDDFPMPDTPDSSGSSDRLLTMTPIPSYQSRIEQSVREIYDSSDMRTEQEEAAARWHEFIKPKLLDTERRPPFDMSVYTARVIQNLEAIDNRRSDLGTMVQQRMIHPTEITRYFAATLQLANTYNVHIDPCGDVEGNLKLVLLKGQTEQ